MAVESFDYEKTVFTWDEPKPPVTVPDRLTFLAVTPKTMQQFVDTIEKVLDGSLDRFDMARLERMTARRIAEQYAYPDKMVFEFALDWWQLAFTATGEIVGFAQPVVFRGAARGSREEGTIHYIGVVPGCRGRGYIVDLLSAATRKLQDISVWRIFCDTDSQNWPMISAFRRVGYAEGETRIVSYHLKQA